MTIVHTYTFTVYNTRVYVVLPRSVLFIMSSLCVVGALRDASVSIEMRRGCPCSSGCREMMHLHLSSLITACSLHSKQIGIVN